LAKAGRYVISPRLRMAAIGIVQVDVPDQREKTSTIKESV
jgi:hypothetical protein